MAVTGLVPPAVHVLVTPAVSTAWACVLAISAATALQAADLSTPAPTVIDLVYLAVVAGIAAFSAWRCRQLWRQWSEYQRALDQAGGDRCGRPRYSPCSA